MGVTRFDETSEATLRRIVDDGITSFKVFLAYKGAFGVTDEELYATCQLAKELGVTVTAHCENADLVAQLQAKLVAAGNIGPEFHEPSRPVSVETEGVHHFCTFLDMTGATGYIVHTSCRGAVEAAQAFQQKGVNVSIETVIPYLVLDKTHAEQADFEGAKYVMSPRFAVRPNKVFFGMRYKLVALIPSQRIMHHSTSKVRKRWESRPSPTSPKFQMAFHLSSIGPRCCIRMAS